MKNLILIVSLSAVLICCFERDLFAETCRVEGILDGDSLMVACNQHNGIVGIRGIDAPDLKQDHGMNSKSFLENTLSKIKEVSLDEFDNIKKRGHIILPDGTSLAARAVMNGNAWAVNRKISSDNFLLRLEKKARKKNKGLWATGKTSLLGNIEN